MIKYTVSFGAILAIIISWSRNKSILLAIFHGVLGWIYVFYYWIGKDEDEAKDSK